MSPRPAAGTILCRLDAIPDPGSKSFRFRKGEAEFAGFVVRRGDGATGYVDSCPHADWPLALIEDRYLTREGDLILCSNHGALFRIDDGACVAGPCARTRLTPWPVAVVEGAVVAA